MPKVWLRLVLPQIGGGLDAARPLVEAALESGVPLDVTSPTALWGALLAGRDAPLLVRGGHGLAQTTSSSHAADWMQAHLFETLCSLQRDRIQTYALAIREPLEEHQIAGALEALEYARSESHLSFAALHIGADPSPALAAWNFHDAFDIAMVPRSLAGEQAFQRVRPFAEERRVGLAVVDPFDWGWGTPFFEIDASDGDPAAAAQAAIALLARDTPVVVPVSSAGGVAAALAASGAAVDEQALAPYRAALSEPGFWTRALESPDASLRKAAAHRLVPVVGSR